MAKHESLFSINPEKVENLAEYIAYCKYYFKHKSEDEIVNYLYQNRENKKWYLDRNKKDALFKDFSFLKQYKDENKLAGKLSQSKYKNNKTLKDFPLNWLKHEIIGSNKVFNFNGAIQSIQKISGIYENPDDLKKHINNLPKYSFAIWFKFKLQAPYFSKDDDEFYIIQNPVLKEKNFKVPMVRGSSWKGSLAHAFRELFNDTDNREKIESFLRIFGAGSESIKALESYISDKTKDLNKLKEKLLEFILFELGLKVDKTLIEKVKNLKTKNDLLEFLKNQISKKLQNNQSQLPLEFQTHKGRAIFYPTYFDRLSIELINPHDRRKRAGTIPIHYEVVPKDTEGIFQLIYIPFDGVLKEDNKLEQEVSQDLKNLCEAIEILSDKGIGAKTKLGWGRFEIIEKKICLNTELTICKGWEKCQEQG